MASWHCSMATGNKYVLHTNKNLSSIVEPFVKFTVIWFSLDSLLFCQAGNDVRYTKQYTVFTV